MNNRLYTLLLVGILICSNSLIALASPGSQATGEPWPTFTSAQLHLSFVYPSGWGVDAPDWQPGPQAMGYTIGLLPPPGDPLAGHSIQISYAFNEIPEGQSLRSWVETDYSASRVSPSEITVLKAQTSDLPDGSRRQMLHTVVRSKGYAPQAIHLTQGRLVLMLATQADPAGLGKVLAQVAASVKFAPDAPQTLNALYGTNRVWPSVEESAKAYLESPYTPPACDSTCRDATAGAILALTPIRTVTQSPAFRATEEAYRARLPGHETRQAQLSAQPPVGTPLPAATWTPTP